jgi:hypothetical protein
VTFPVRLLLHLLYRTSPFMQAQSMAFNPAMKQCFSSSVTLQSCKTLPAQCETIAERKNSYLHFVVASIEEVTYHLCDE